MTDTFSSAADLGAAMRKTTTELHALVGSLMGWERGAANRVKVSNLDFLGAWRRAGDDLESMADSELPSLIVALADQVREVARRIPLKCSLLDWHSSGEAPYLLKGTERESVILAALDRIGQPDVSQAEEAFDAFVENIGAFYGVDLSETPRERIVEYQSMVSRTLRRLRVSQLSQGGATPQLLGLGRYLLMVNGIGALVDSAMKGGDAITFALVTDPNGDILRTSHFVAVAKNGDTLTLLDDHRTYCSPQFDFPSKAHSFSGHNDPDIHFGWPYRLTRELEENTIPVPRGQPVVPLIELSALRPEELVYLVLLASEVNRIYGEGATQLPELSYTAHQAILLSSEAPEPEETALSLVGGLSKVVVRQTALTAEALCAETEEMNFHRERIGLNDWMLTAWPEVVSGVDVVTDHPMLSTDQLHRSYGSLADLRRRAAWFNRRRIAHTLSEHAVMVYERDFALAVSWVRQRLKERVPAIIDHILEGGGAWELPSTRGNRRNGISVGFGSGPGVRVREQKAEVVDPRWGGLLAVAGGASRERTCLLDPGTRAKLAVRVYIDCSEALSEVLDADLSSSGFPWLAHIDHGWFYTGNFDWSDPLDEIGRPWDRQGNARCRREAFPQSVHFHLSRRSIKKRCKELGVELPSWYTQEV